MNQSISFQSALYNQLDPQSKQRAMVARIDSPVEKNLDQIQTAEGRHLPGAGWGKTSWAVCPLTKRGTPFVD